MWQMFTNAMINDGKNMKRHWQTKKMIISSITCKSELMK